MDLAETRRETARMTGNVVQAWVFLVLATCAARYAPAAELAAWQSWRMSLLAVMALGILGPLAIALVRRVTAARRGVYGTAVTRLAVGFLLCGGAPLAAMTCWAGGATVGWWIGRYGGARGTESPATQRDTLAQAALMGMYALLFIAQIKLGKAYDPALAGAAGAGTIAGAFMLVQWASREAAGGTRG